MADVTKMGYVEIDETYKEIRKAFGREKKKSQQNIATLLFVYLVEKLKTYL